MATQSDNLSAAVFELRELVDRAGDGTTLLNAIHHQLQEHTNLLRDISKKGGAGGGGGGSGGDGSSQSGRRARKRAKAKVKAGRGAMRAGSGRMLGRMIGGGGRLAGGGMAGMAGRALGGVAMAGGALGAIAGIGAVAIGAAVALKAFHDAVDQATTGAIEAARKYADVSGPMAAVMAERDLKEMLRNQRMGNAQAAGVKGLADAEQRRKDASEELINASTDLKNALLSVLNDMLADVLKPLGKFVKEIRDLLLGEQKDDIKPIGLAGTMPSVMAHAQALNDTVAKMHQQAHDAAGRASGYSAPSGATGALGPAFPRAPRV